jgi:hypothetical protein
VFYGCASFRVFVSWFYCSCVYVGIYTFMLSATGCWVSSTTCVGFTGVVSGDGISSTLTNFGGCCSPSSNCTRDLVLTLDCLAI